MDCLTKDAEEQMDRFGEHVRIGIVYFDSFLRLYTYTCIFIHSILSMSHFLRSSSARAHPLDVVLPFKDKDLIF